MTKTEVKKLVKTCVETLAKAKNIDLSISNIDDNKTMEALIFDIVLETMDETIYGTKICLNNTILKSLLTEDYEGKAELGKSIISKIWSDIREFVDDDPLDRQMKNSGFNKIKVPGMSGVGGIYTSQGTPQIIQNGDGTYIISMNGISLPAENANDAIKILEVFNTMSSNCGPASFAEQEYEFELESEEI